MDLSNKLKNGTKNNSTFGSPFGKSSKQVWAGCESEFLGKAPGNLLGNTNL